MPKYVIYKPVDGNWETVAQQLCDLANRDYEILSTQQIANAAKLEELRSTVLKLSEACVDVGFVRMCMHVVIDQMGALQKENDDMRARLASIRGEGFPESGL